MSWRINTWELPEAERGALYQLRHLHPELPVWRKKAQRELHAAIAAVVEPAEYKEEKTGIWVRRGWLASTYVQIQKGRSGAECFINVGRESRWEPNVPSYKNNTAWRLSEFADDIAAGNRISEMHYHDLATDPQYLPYLMALLAGRAMPFLKRCHGLNGPNERPPR